MQVTKKALMFLPGKTGHTKLIVPAGAPVEPAPTCGKSGYSWVKPWDGANRRALAYLNDPGLLCSPDEVEEVTVAPPKPHLRQRRAK